MITTVKTYRYRITFYTANGIKRCDKMVPKLPLHLLVYSIPSAACVDCN